MTTESQDGTRTGKRAKNFQTWWRLAALALICATWCATWPLAAAAEPRLALIIGNSEYGSEMGRLPNPANDAKLMSDALKSVGFETITLIDADQKSLKRAISDFGQKLTEKWGQNIVVDARVPALLVAGGLLALRAPFLVVVVAAALVAAGLRALGWG